MSLFGSPQAEVSWRTCRLPSPTTRSWCVPRVPCVASARAARSTDGDTVPRPRRQRPHHGNDPRTVAGDDMAGPLRIGVVGAGNISGEYLATLSRLPNVQLAQVATRDVRHA